MVHEVLQRLREALDRPGSEYGVSGGLRSVATIAGTPLAASLAHRPLGEPGEGGDGDPRGAQRLVLADDQVGEEHGDVPVAAQGRGGSVQGEGGVAERLALAAGEGG